MTRPDDRAAGAGERLAAAGRPPLGRVEHFAIEGPWICVACGADWPCEAARRDLVEEYRDRPTALYIYLAICLDAALYHWSLVNPYATPTGYVDRFLGWVAGRLDRHDGDRHDRDRHDRDRHDEVPTARPNRSGPAVAGRAR